MVLDPNLKEEAVMEGRMTITLNSHREVCAMQKAGGTPIALGKLLECSKIAAAKVAELTQLLQQALKAPEKKLLQPYASGISPLLPFTAPLPTFSSVILSGR